MSPKKKAANPSIPTSAKDLVGLSKQLNKIASERIARIPGMDYLRDEFEVIEDAMLQSLHKRLRRAVDHENAYPAIEGTVELADEPSGESTLDDDIVLAPTKKQLTPPQRLQNIMESALAETVEQATDAWAHQILDQLVGDELRILSALSDGDKYPTVGVKGAPSLTASTVTLMQPISSVIKAARLKVRELLPSYLQHLENLQLVTFGKEESAYELDYQVLEAETEVMRCISEAQLDGMSRVSASRGTLKITSIGTKFWQLCRD